MPIYEFTCLDCNKDSELLVRTSSWKGSATCPECSSTKLEKKLSVFSAGNSSDQNFSGGEQKAVREVMMFLQTYGVTDSLCLRLVRKYGNSAKTSLLPELLSVPPTPLEYF